MKNLPLPCPYLVQKNVISVKPTLCYWPKKQIGKALFISIFMKIISRMPIWRKRPFSKKHTALMLICCQKNVPSLKNKMLSSHFLQNFMKIPCVYAHIWSEKCRFCQNYTRLWAKEVNRMPFFTILTKNHCCHSHILSKKRPFPHSLENKRLLCPYLVKNRQCF